MSLGFPPNLAFAKKLGGNRRPQRRDRSGFSPDSRLTIPKKKLRDLKLDYILFKEQITKSFSRPQKAVNKKK